MKNHPFLLWGGTGDNKDINMKSTNEKTLSSKKGTMKAKTMDNSKTIGTKNAIPDSPFPDSTPITDTISLNKKAHSRILFSPYGECGFIPIDYVHQFKVLVEESDDPVRTRLAAHIYYQTTNCLHDLDELFDYCFNAHVQEKGLKDDHVCAVLASLVEEANDLIGRANLFCKVYVLSDEVSLIQPIKARQKDFVREPENVIITCFHALECVEGLLLQFGLKHPDVYFALEAVAGYR